VVGIPTGAGRLAGEAVTGQGRYDDIEGILAAPTMRGRIRQWTDNLELLDDGAWPAVRDDHWQRILLPATDLDEVNADPVDHGRELRPSIEGSFDLAPVVTAPPVRNQLLQPEQRGALRLIGYGFLVRPACGGDAPAQVLEVLLGNIDAKGVNCVIPDSRPRTTGNAHGTC